MYRGVLSLLVFSQSRQDGIDSRKLGARLWHDMRARLHGKDGLWGASRAGAELVGRSPIPAFSTVCKNIAARGAALSVVVDDTVVNGDWELDYTEGPHRVRRKVIVGTMHDALNAKPKAWSVAGETSDVGGIDDVNVATDAQRSGRGGDSGKDEGDEAAFVDPDVAEGIVVINESGFTGDFGDGGGRSSPALSDDLPATDVHSDPDDDDGDAGGGARKDKPAAGDDYSDEDQRDDGGALRVTVLKRSHVTFFMQMTT